MARLPTIICALSNAMLLVAQLHDNSMINRLFVKVRCRSDFEQYNAAPALLIFLRSLH